MKLPIKKKWFDQIVSEKKVVEFRDAHITFTCIETGEEILCSIESAKVVHKNILPESVRKDGCVKDTYVLRMRLQAINSSYKNGYDL